MATWWRLESPLVAETSPRRLLETSWVSGKSREIQTCSIFFETFSSLQQVSETSRRLILSATGETSPRRLRDLLETKETVGDVVETSPQLRRRSWRRRGDIPATSGRIDCHLVWRCLRDVSETSPWWERKPFCGLPSRPGCRDWSVAETSPPMR